MTLEWSHPSLEPRQDYSVKGGRVFMGRTIIAYLRGRNVVTLDGKVLGKHDSPAHAMLMVIRYQQQLASLLDRPGIVF